MARERDETVGKFNLHLSESVRLRRLVAELHVLQR